MAISTSCSHFSNKQSYVLNNVLHYWLINTTVGCSVRLSQLLHRDTRTSCFEVVELPQFMLPPFAIWMLIFRKFSVRLSLGAFIVIGVAEMLSTWIALCRNDCLDNPWMNVISDAWIILKLAMDTPKTLQDYP